MVRTADDQFFRSVEPFGLTLALIRGGEFDSPPLTGPYRLSSLSKSLRKRTPPSSGSFTRNC